MWGPQIIELAQIAEQEHMRAAEAAALRREAGHAGRRNRLAGTWTRIRRDRRDGS